MWVSEGGAGGWRWSRAPPPFPGCTDMSHCHLHCPFCKHGGFSQRDLNSFWYIFFLSHVPLHSVFMDFPPPQYFCYNNLRLMDWGSGKSSGSSGSRLVSQGEVRGSAVSCGQQSLTSLP